MSAETQIVAAMYREQPALEFDQIVDEFEQSLRTNNSGRRSMTFDYDDLVIIEIGALRIGLAWVEPDCPEQPFSLVVATGAGPDHAQDSVSSETFARLADKILARIRKRIPYDTLIRAKLPSHLDSEILDHVACGLHGLKPVAEATPVTDRVLDDVATPQAPAYPAPSPSRSAMEQDRWARRERGITRLREIYRDDQSAPESPLWQAVMAGTNTMVETLSQGAEMVRQVSSNGQSNPYERLKTRPITRPLYRAAERFDRSEYELYGNLLD